MSKPMSKTTEKVVPKKVYKISIKYHSDGKSMILRKDLSALIDTTDKSLAWLKAHDFKAEDIEIIGDKPYGWDLYYPAPVVEPDPVLVEKLAEVLAAPPTDTIAVTTVNLDSGTVIQEQVGDVFEGLPVAPVADPFLIPSCKAWVSRKRMSLLLRMSLSQSRILTFLRPCPSKKQSRMHPSSPMYHLTSMVF